MENIMLRRENLMETDDTGALKDKSGPVKIYDEVKDRLMQFLETDTARQLRVRASWDVLMKGKRSALEFGAEWDKLLAELEEVGLPRDAKSLALDYLLKIGTAETEKIRMDRRERPMPDGTMRLRVPETWQEFHEVLCEVDSVKGSAKALTVARAGPQSGHPKPRSSWRSSTEEGPQSG